MTLSLFGGRPPAPLLLPLLLLWRGPDGSAVEAFSPALSTRRTTSTSTSVSTATDFDITRRRASSFFYRPSATALSAVAKSKKKSKKGGGGGGGGGFGAAKSKSSSVATIDDDGPAFTPIRNKGPKYEFGTSIDNANGDEIVEDTIENHLNPRLFQDPSTLDDVRARLRSGEIVVIRDAFKSDFADAMHRELLSTSTWSRNEAYLEDGYHYRHYNVYDKSDYSQFFNSTVKMLNTEATKEFMTELTGRDCTGEVVGSPSYYGGGDHSLPHTDHFGQRTVAYVWHLSKNWRPEWGGGLYWAQEPLANAYLHASYNTLVLFSVTPLSSHFVTTVSPHATEKRLSFNGWWTSSWEPALEGNKCADSAETTAANGGEGVPLEDMIDTPEKRLRLTYDQYVTIERLLNDPWSPRVEPPERKEALDKLFERHMGESYPSQRSPPI